MVGSWTLQLIMSFVPTFFAYIFSFFFVLKAHARLQHGIQIWYFWFLIMYVLLVIAVGSSTIAMISKFAQDPMHVFEVVEGKMPDATHFYLSFIPVQWVTHPHAMLRVTQLAKFLGFRITCSEEQAKALVEPEGQDYHGIGSRNARNSFNLVLVVVFCSLTPLINLLGFVNFLVCRLCYGYLIPFAETRKPDLGGAFWVTNLMNIQRCLSMYIVLMAGVLCYRVTSTSWPCIIAASSMIYWYKSFAKFQDAFQWEAMSFEDIAEALPGSSKRSQATYSQTELLEA